MRRSTASFLSVVLVASMGLTVVACSDDNPVGQSAPQTNFKNLTERDDVLFNLQLAHNRRDITEYDKLLDPDFRFLLAAGDVKVGLPSFWDRTTEVGANQCFFDRAGCMGKPLATSVAMELLFGGVQWVGFQPASAPDETWYTTTVFYNFQIEFAPDTKYIPYAGAKAQFTVRNAGTDEAPQWKLLEMRELSANSGLNASAAARTSTEETTWGRVKSLYVSIETRCKDLTTRENVLNNIECAYNERNIAEYDQLLDPGFVFFLADGDVNGGLPVSWDRTTEIGANRCLFDWVGCQNKPLATSMQMDLLFENSLQWVSVIPSSAPDETWYTTTVFYNFQVEVQPDTKYYSYAGAKTQFTVRNAGTDEAPQWKLAEMRDLGAYNLMTAAAARTSTQESTWGGVKSLSWGGVKSLYR
ncbi:MAG TPA: hypothetical protein VFX92_02195 [Candidatus Krumholzibacteria bacterium]|nr:hypothetical protein [Candidatus Krumholzibacteria bacterium]